MHKALLNITTNALQAHNNFENLRIIFFYSEIPSSNTCVDLDSLNEAFMCWSKKTYLEVQVDKLCSRFYDLNYFGLGYEKRLLVLNDYFIFHQKNEQKIGFYFQETATISVQHIRNGLTWILEYLSLCQH